MSKPNFPQIEKSLSLRLIELSDSIEIIRDCLELFRQGKSYHIRTLSGQLRSLLFERKSKRIKNPLIFTISEGLKLELVVYYKPLILDRNGLTIAYNRSMVTTERKSSDQKEASLKGFLKETFLIFNQVEYTIGDVIYDFANHFGGSHYSEKIPTNKAGIFEKAFGSTELFSFADHIIIEISEFAFQLGLKIMRLVSGFVWFSKIYIPQQKIEIDSYLYDVMYEGTPIRTSIVVNADRCIVFTICDNRGFCYKVESSKPLKFDSYQSVQVIYGFNEDYETVIKIFVNGQCLASKIYKKVLFFRNSFEAFTMYVNRTKQNEQKGFVFGLKDQMIIPPDKYNPTVFSKLNEIIKKEKELRWFEKGAFGHKVPNQSMIFKNVKVLTLKEYLQQD